MLLERLEPRRPHGAVDHAVVARERDLVRVRVRVRVRARARVKVRARVLVKGQG